MYKEGTQVRLAVWLGGFLLLSSIGVAEAAVQVELDGNRLTVRAENTPLQDILQAVADAGHIALRLEAPLADKLSVQIDQKPVLDALDSLLQDQSSLIRYTRNPDGVRVEEVQVFAPSPPAGRKAPTSSTSNTSDSFNTFITPWAALSGFGNVSASGASGPPGGDVPAAARAPSEASPPGKLATALDLLTGDQAETGRAMLVDLLKTDEDPNVRQSALFALGSAPTIPLQEVAKAAIADEDPSVRLVALKVLTDKAQADPTTRGILQQISQKDNDAQVRSAATALLGGS
jgi:HEAT repeat protein